MVIRSISSEYPTSALARFIMRRMESIILWRIAPPGFEFMNSSYIIAASFLGPPAISMKWLVNSDTCGIFKPLWAIALRTCDGTFFVFGIRP